METYNFGEHLMLDGYGGDYEKLNNRNLVLLSLNELPDKLGMKKLSEPCVFEAADNEIKDPGGFSGFVVIMESHISVHTFPARKFISIDVYTCRNGLNRDMIKKYFANLFNLQNIEENFVIRGKKYPAQNIS